MPLRETNGLDRSREVQMKQVLRGAAVAVVAVTIVATTMVGAEAKARFRGVTFTNDLITLVAPFTEAGLKPKADATVHLSASSWARYSCILPTGKRSGVVKTVDAGKLSSRVSGKANASGAYSDTAYLDPHLVYPDCPGKQHAHLERVCFTHPRLADKESGATYADPNVKRLCIRTA
jgi:hypothetical protein